MLGVEDGGIVNGVLDGILVDVGILAVAEVARVVIVQQVVVAGFAMRIDAEGLQIADDRADAGLRGIGAIAIRSAAVNREE